MIRRKIASELQSHLNSTHPFQNVILVEGARQVGKTTLVQSVLETLPSQKFIVHEFNLEENQVISEKIDQCQNFAEFQDYVQFELGVSFGKNHVLFIDEAQESRKLGSFVRFMKEKWERTFVILSGSSMGRLFRDETRYPIGRVSPILVHPFSFQEFLWASPEKKIQELSEKISFEETVSQTLHQILLNHFNTYLTIGGLPEVVTTYHKKGESDWQKLRHHLLLGYYNDFKRVYGEELQAYFVAALKASSHLLGSPFKNSYVAQLLDGGKNQEIIKTLSRLETWHMLHKSDQRGMSVSTNFHPKRYIFDVGIAKELRERSLQQIHLLNSTQLQRDPLGGLIENFTAIVLLREGLCDELSGWKKSSSGSEVDFVIKVKDEIIPIESKSALKFKKTFLAGLKDFMQIHNSPFGILTSLAPFEKIQLNDKKVIYNIPLYLLEELPHFLKS